MIECRGKSKNSHKTRKIIFLLINFLHKKFLLAALKLPLPFLKDVYQESLQAKSFKYQNFSHKN